MKTSCSFYLLSKQLNFTLLLLEQSSDIVKYFIEVLFAFICFSYFILTFVINFGPIFEFVILSNYN